MHRTKTKLSLLCLLSLLALPLWWTSPDVQSQAGPDPAEAGPCGVSGQLVSIGGDLQTYVLYPDSDECGADFAAPYPGIAWAHGFSMFGIINMALGHEGDGVHLASWGYVVAIPVLPDEPEERVANIQEVLSYLQDQTGTAGSFLQGLVDVDRLAVAGHSFGGATVLAVAARDPRVKAVVSMDPVYHQGGPFPGEEPAFWDPEAEGPLIEAPTCILGAPSNNCNSESDYLEIYPFVGSVHKAQLLVSGASHCDFMDPGYGLCTMFCGGDMDPARTKLAQKYTTAWFNYYLHRDTGNYDYLYGSEASADTAAGRIQAQIDTAPTGFGAQAQGRSASLQWELYEHPVVAGYNVYRRLPDQSYAATPDAQLGLASAYLDDGLAAGQAYFYTVRSRDPAGNEHQAATEIEIVAQSDITPTGSPPAPGTATATPTASPTVTHVPTATPTASPTPTRTATPAPSRTPTTMPSATPTPTPTRGPGPCRLFLPAVFVGAGGVGVLATRQRRFPEGER